MAIVISICGKEIMKEKMFLVLSLEKCTLHAIAKIKAHNKYFIINF